MTVTARAMFESKVSRGSSAGMDAGAETLWWVPLKIISCCSWAGAVSDLCVGFAVKCRTKHENTVLGLRNMGNGFISTCGKMPFQQFVPFHFHSRFVCLCRHGWQGRNLELGGVLQINTTTGCNGTIVSCT